MPRKRNVTAVPLRIWTSWSEPRMTRKGGVHNRLPWVINKLIIQYSMCWCAYMHVNNKYIYIIYVYDYVYIAYVCMHVCLIHIYIYVCIYIYIHILCTVIREILCIKWLPYQMTSQLSLVWDARQCWWWQTRNSRSPKPFTKNNVKNKNLTATWERKKGRTKNPQSVDPRWVVTCPRVKLIMNLG